MELLNPPVATSVTEVIAKKRARKRRSRLIT
jgi:hypothetical protein